jgi:lactoylglutathione lyase
VKVSQIRLLVDDFPGCFRFYREVLGLQPSFGDEASGYASFSTEGGTVALFERGDQGDVVELRAPGDSALLVLEVDDADQEAQRLGEHLVEGPVSKPEWGGRVAYVRDPEGKLVELFQEIPMGEG